MRTRATLALASAAVVVLAFGVGTATARRFEFSNQLIRAVWPAFRLEDGVLMRRQCPVSIEGSFHSRIISKVSGDLIGFITRAITAKAACEAEGESLWLSPGDMAAVNSLPWHIRYDSFLGALPNIATIRLQVVELRVKSLGPSCEYRSSEARPAYLRLQLLGGAVSRVEWDEVNRIPRIAGTCGAEATVSGSGSWKVLGTTTAITVRLVA